jgi:lipoate-protein ligase A
MQIRLLPYAIADGAANMAADETLVRSAADGVASLRFYGWLHATVSLGYFQSHLVRGEDPLLASLPWVRRPSGGATLVHQHELTYALALPPAPEWHRGDPWLRRMHRIIVEALSDLGMRDQLVLVKDQPIKHGDILCFQQFTPGDVLCNGRKVVGSAQRKYRQALLQHGSILLKQCEYTSQLPGLRELTGVALSSEQVQDAVIRQFNRCTGWHMDEGDWTTTENGCLKSLVEDRYANPEWNERR